MTDRQAPSRRPPNRLQPVLARWAVLALHGELLAEGAPRPASWTLLQEGLSAAPEPDCWARLVSPGIRGAEPRYVVTAYAPGTGEPGAEKPAWHLSGAPAWVHLDESRQYSAVAWWDEGRWGSSTLRFRPVDERRPWHDRAISASLAALESDEATVDALAMLLWEQADAWSYDPARSWAAELLPLARTAWNAMVDPDVALDPDRLSAHLVALSGHLRRSPVGTDEADRTARLAYQSWGHLAGATPLGLAALGAPPAPYDITRHALERADVLPIEGAPHVSGPAGPDPADQELGQAVRRTLGWALLAIRAAADGTPRGRRSHDLDAYGLVARTHGGPVVRLTAPDPAHQVLSVHRTPEPEPTGLLGRMFGRGSAVPERAHTGRPAPHDLPRTPDWVDMDTVRRAGGEIEDLDWCVRGRWDYRRWSGTRTGGFAMPGAAQALADVVPIAPEDLAEVLDGLHPRGHAARDEVGVMRAAVEAFLAGRGPLALGW